MAEPQHFAIPFRFGPGGAATNPQDSPEEVADAVELTLRTVRGERTTLPDFGRPDEMEFSSDVELMRAQLVTAVDEAEPRARLYVEGGYEDESPGMVRLRVMFSLITEGEQ